jgi:phenylacetate-coenzyme A ligase PaaK-like adenylate-forming protein
MQNLDSLYKKNLNLISNLNSFFYDNKKKKKFFLKTINILQKIHLKNSLKFRLIMKKFDKTKNKNLNELPFLSARIFKEIELKSIPDSEIFKILKSSGTTGTQSKIFLNKKNALMQSQVLTKIFNDFFNTKKRFPMIIIDSKNVFENRKSFSARGAGILGFSVFGKDHFYLLDDNNEIREDELIEYIEKYKNEEIFLFGFTSIVWEKLINFNFKKKINLNNSFLLHGGGWKKLLKKNISNQKFKSRLMKKFDIQKIHNYYGMIEQIGSIFFECEDGFFHTSIFSEIFVRDKKFNVVEEGQKGIIQLLSLIPTSYPGHSILTEDEGIVFGEDKCKCGKKGKFFKIIGRLKKSETRGCSDTYDT